MTPFELMNVMNLFWPPASNPPTLDAGEAHIWAVPIDDISQRQPELSRLLSAEEQARAEQFRCEEPARRFIGARAALRTLLSHYLSAPASTISLSFDAQTKPRIASGQYGTDVRFNVSHSGMLALVAVTIGNEIGVDVEQRREVKHLDQIASRYFHPTEAAAVAATPLSERNNAFLRCWTAKEAVLKAHGTGITHSLDSFAVPLAETGAGWVDLSGVKGIYNDLQCWVARLAPHHDFLSAVAVMNVAPRLVCHTFVM
jgi:4'-phosphopantetheinyl transferase